MIMGKPNVAMPHALRQRLRARRSDTLHRRDRAGGLGVVERVGHVEVDALHARQRPRRQQAPDSAAHLRRVGHAADRARRWRSIRRSSSRSRDFFSYALGWFIQDYRGQQVWMHTGSIDGMCAIIGLEPNKKLGVYVLENLDHAELRHGLDVQRVRPVRNGPRRDWSADLKPLFARAPRATVAQAARVTSPPSLPLDRYAGTYVDSAYGDVRVTFENGALQAAVVTDPAAALEPVSFEAFRTKPSAGVRPTVLTFVPDGNGGVSAVRIFNILFARERARR